MNSWLMWGWYPREHPDFAHMCTPEQSGCASHQRNVGGLRTRFKVEVGIGSGSGSGDSWLELGQGARDVICP